MKTFVTADLHLDHKNIIKYCNRPFTDVNKMNRILVNNWNNIISPKDTVYFLGDLSFHTEYWIPKLNGDITFIKGNHDKFHETKFYNNYVLKYGGIYFYLTHRPEHIPRDWNGWAIYGHVHNNYPKECPFFERKNKRFNVSTEMTNYKPVNMDYIMESINGRVEKLCPSKPKKWWQFWK